MKPVGNDYGPEGVAPPKKRPKKAKREPKNKGSNRIGRYSDSVIYLQLIG